MMYSAGMPVLYFFAVFFMAITYWTDKWVLLRCSRRPPTYDARMATQVATFMLYVVFVHCGLGLIMLGQPCVFPSNKLVGAEDVKEMSPNEALAAATWRFGLESTWLQGAMLIGLVVAWVLWMVMWVLGGSLGTALQCLSACCNKSTKVVPVDSDEALKTPTWGEVEHKINELHPPASYKVDENPPPRYEDIKALDNTWLGSTIRSGGLGNTSHSNSLEAGQMGATLG
jgi:hypothetical protein